MSMYMDSINRRGGYDSSLEKQRLANLDLLRGLCAIFVVFEHFCETSARNAFGFSLEASVSAHLLLRFMYGIARTAVPVFFLLSGYLSIAAHWQKIGKVINLFFMTSAYEALAYIAKCGLAAIKGEAEFSLSSFAFSVFPCNYYLYLFSAVYILSPFLNSIVKTMSQKNYLRLIIITFVLFSCWSTVINILSIVVGREGIAGVYFTSLKGTSMGFNIANFASLYLIGGYIRLYYKPNGMKDLIPAVIVIVACAIITSAVAYLSLNFSKVFLYYDSVFVVIPTIAMLIVFLNIKISSNKILSFMGKHTFGTYLLHGYTSSCIEKIVSIQSVVSRGFGGTLLGIVVFVFGTYVSALLMTGIIEFMVKPLNDMWKRTKIYNCYFYE